MSFALISFIVSGVSAILMVLLKATVFKNRHVHVWVKARQVSDSYLHRGAVKTKAISSHATHQSLLKIVAVIYHKIIPTVEKVYRAIASFFYKCHRRAWRFLEYSKHSTHQVSEYLRHLSDHKNKL